MGVVFFVIHIYRDVGCRVGGFRHRVFCPEDFSARRLLIAVVWSLFSFYYWLDTMGGVVFGLRYVWIVVPWGRL